MEEAMNKFQAKVGSAEQKLESIEKKIDDEFSRHLSSPTEECNDEIEDKEALLKTLAEVKSEYKSLCQEAAELSQAQRQMAETFQHELLAQVKQLQVLQDRGLTGSERKLDAEAQAAVNELVRKADGDVSLSQSLNSSDLG